MLVPEAEAVVKECRNRDETSAADGTPAPITVPYPFCCLLHDAASFSRMLRWSLGPRCYASAAAFPWAATSLRIGLTTLKRFQ
jgi:hypothetical protein